MIRVVGIQLLFFLSPFLVYGFYLYFTGRDPMIRESWSRNAVYWLAIVGLVLTIASFVYLALSSRSESFVGDVSFGPSRAPVETGIPA